MPATATTELPTNRNVGRCPSSTQAIRLAGISRSAKTVATHKYRVYEKLGVDSEVALTLLALQYGLIQRP